MDSTDAPRLGPHLVDETLPTPLYHQIYMMLRERIISGELAAQTLLPGEHEMAKLLEVSRITVKRAMNELAARGLVHRQRGRGTTVAGGAVIPLVASSFDTLFESLERMRLQTDIELLDVREEPAGARIASRLEAAPTLAVQRAVRLRKLDGEPFSHLTSWIPTDLAARYSRDDLATTSLLTLLERAGARVEEAEQWITAVAAPPSIATALSVAAGAPLLKIERVMRGPKRRPVQFIEVLYRPDRYHYHLRTQRRRGGEADAGWETEG
jgi:GntR family transcriptional regulator